MKKSEIAWWLQVGALFCGSASAVLLVLNVLMGSTFGALAMAVCLVVNIIIFFVNRDTERTWKRLDL